eukprot:Awhi_evm1s14489
MIADSNILNSFYVVPSATPPTRRRAQTLNLSPDEISFLRERSKTEIERRKRASIFETLPMRRRAMTLELTSMQLSDLRAKYRAIHPEFRDV